MAEEQAYQRRRSVIPIGRLVAIFQNAVLIQCFSSHVGRFDIPIYPATADVNEEVVEGRGRTDGPATRIRKGGRMVGWAKDGQTGGCVK